ncbi:DUF1648 domain-containing protein [Streptomyces piniterrae]|uniref:DUF1648 domain-containing protein n=1 Tax=Streptomyces piniterrae TaxID=2571125 RepID=A0A4V5MJL3_9ACTN|nr:DUF1648 domain-containing protein [Streptomyces piniterrae]TJZ49648.1 DUF1648 domain-containing protein [Streptomyces piniterrae]
MKSAKSGPRSVLPSTRPLRPWIAVFPFLIALLAIAGVLNGVSGRLPDPLATHFGPDGKPDGYSSIRGFLTASLAALLLIAVGSGVLAQLRRTAPVTRWVISAGWGAAVMFALPVCLTLLANAHARDADAVRFPMWQVAAWLGAAVLAGGLGWLLAGPDTRTATAPSDGAPRLALAEGESAVWSHTVSSPLLALLGALMLGAGVLLGFLDGWLTGAILLVSALAVIAVGSVRVTVDRRGLRLASTLLGVRFRCVPFDRVTEAVGRQVQIAAEFGGWGYRVRPDRTGLVLRSGEGLVLRLTSGREFVVTVDDAATGAALFNAYLDRARTRQNSPQDSRRSPRQGG